MGRIPMRESVKKEKDLRESAKIGKDKRGKGTKGTERNGRQLYKGRGKCVSESTQPLCTQNMRIR